jgi:diketogulonate reductase-like aldo/keto reductase
MKPWSICCRGSRTASRSRRAKSPVPGYWLSHGSCRFPGTTKLHRLEENIKAADVELTVDDLRHIESAALEITIQGARYSDAMERLTNR